MGKDDPVNVRLDKIKIENALSTIRALLMAAT